MSLFLDFIYPRLCYGCCAPNTYLCPSCSNTLLTREVRHSKDSLFDGNISIFRYTGVIRQMIEDYKFNFVFDLAPIFSNLIYQHLQSDFPHILKYWQENNFSLVPVPLYPARQNWRGFNQSILIGELLSPKLKLKFIPDLLIRSTASIPQSTIADKRLRRQNTQNVFSINQTIVGASLAEARNFILLDDVYTTGSTLNSAASCITNNQILPSPSLSKIEDIASSDVEGPAPAGGRFNSNLWSLTIAG